MEDFIKKEDFIKIMEDIERADTYSEKLNRFLKNNNADGYIYQPNCVEAALRLLHLLLKDYDKNNWIEYFCLELDFGKKWKENALLDENGNNIKLKTFEDLYDLLSSCK